MIARRRITDLIDQPRIELTAGKLSASPTARILVTPEAEVIRMGRQQTRLRALRVGAVARPPIFARVLDYPRTYRIQLDVALVGHAGAKPPLPQGRASPPRPIEVLDIALTETLHPRPRGVTRIRQPVCSAYSPSHSR